MKIRTDTEKVLTFDLEISGTRNIPDVRVVMETNNENMNLVFPGKIENGVATVVIPVLSDLQNYLDENVSLSLETIVDGNHAVIWEQKDVLVEKPVVIKTKEPKLEEKEKEAIKVKSIKEQEVSRKAEPVQTYNNKPDSELGKKEIEGKKDKKKKKTLQDMLLSGE